MTRVRGEHLAWWRALVTKVAAHGYLQFYVELAPTWIPELIAALASVGAATAADVVRRADALADTYRVEIERARRSDRHLPALYPRAAALWELAAPLLAAAPDAFAAFARHFAEHPEDVGAVEPVAAYELARPALE